MGGTVHGTALWPKDSAGRRLVKMAARYLAGAAMAL
jgi:hypothetical protein